MGDLYRRPRSPYWYFDVMINGERLRGSTRREKKAEAQQVLQAKIKDALDRKQLGDRPEITLREALFDHYLPNAEAGGYKSLVHLTRYARYLCGDGVHEARTPEGVIVREPIKGLGAGGSQTLSRLTETMLRTYRNQRLTMGMSQQSVDHELKAACAAYNLVRRDYHTAGDLEWPLARIKGKARYLTPGEETALLADLEPTRMRVKGGGVTQIDPLAIVAKQRRDNYDLAVMLLDTGCRFGEIAKLTWIMVDTVGWTAIRVYRSKVEKAGGTAREGRLAITARMREVLRRRYAERKNSPYVFAGWAEDPSVVRTSTAAIRRAINRVGINSPANVARFGKRDVRSFRDTFATKVVPKVGIYGVQRLLGHSTPEMSQKYAYLDADNTSLDAAAWLNQMGAATEEAR